MSDGSELAIFGGVPAFPQGQPDWPRQSEAIREHLHAAWASGDWGRYHGKNCEQLVDRLQKFHTVARAHLVSSGTIAVELALRGVGVQPQQKVVLAAYDFPGNFRAVEAIGAWPILVDIDPTSFTISIEQFEAALSAHNDVAALVVSHLHGGLADMPAIMSIARSRGIPVVEDACQAIGASIAGQVVGGLGDVGVLSFGGSKLLTAGRGGAILTNDETIFQKIKIFGDRGNDAFPLSELQASVLLPQLTQLPSGNQVRETSVARLCRLTGENLGLRPMTISRTGRPSYYKMAWHFQQDDCHWSRAGLIDAMIAEGMGVGEGFRGFGRRSSRRCTKVGELTASKAAAEETILLHHPVLGESAQTVDRVAETIKKVCAYVAN